ncbi:uncharacterized protein K452DRAFT_30083 [Aplosporella prunicola CBS 121167]|uniref:Uncharacterized protein n=1 Tax=Aplosporella prunicola CBS 121167 TaxID=1176127 RepID=A0A6A6BBP5_9PEZI|nr:uncharacterized protein K452DRAFT_30083 [Aplosporella prunicola CBS 121167]KAF2141540.1 hypothetical protein K452DRAFT_30083 [Aplosporella prunicola CBS 121167]
MAPASVNARANPSSLSLPTQQLPQRAARLHTPRRPPKPTTTSRGTSACTGAAAAACAAFPLRPARHGVKAAGRAPWGPGCGGAGLVPRGPVRGGQKSEIWALRSLYDRGVDGRVDGRASPTLALCGETLLAHGGQGGEVLLFVGRGLKRRRDGEVR